VTLFEKMPILQAFSQYRQKLKTAKTVTS
jgi:hypothetical protein